MEQKLTRSRSWRKLVKKLQRKRRRQKLAHERDKQLADDELKKLQDPLYKSWLENEQEVERIKLIVEKNERDEQEEQWMRRELIAQKQFHRDEQKRKEQEAERFKQEADLMKQEEIKQKYRNELLKQAEKRAKEFEKIMNSMQEYLENYDIKTPTNLENHVESRPGEKLCEFYEKTNCCRYGPGCTFNHKRPMLAKIIVIRHFFHHPLLEKQEHEEYARGDPKLEFSERDLRESYDEFCNDVWPELESFGKIVNFRTVRNEHLHLRGHVFVEFAEKRYALKAFTKLQNRFYASRRLNVEFSNILHWRSGVCGMLSRNLLKGLSLGRRCPKGSLCNFLHIMKNPEDKYNTPMSSPTRTPRTNIQCNKTSLETVILSWNNLDAVEGKTSTHRNWRWSESPEMETIVNNTSATYSGKSSEDVKKSNRRHRSKSSSRDNTIHSSYSKCLRLPSPTLDNASKGHHPNKNSSCEEKKYLAKTEDSGNFKHHKRRKSKSPRLSHHNSRRYKSKSASKEYKSKHKISKRHQNKEGKS